MGCPSHQAFSRTPHMFSQRRALLLSPSPSIPPSFVPRPEAQFLVVSTFHLPGVLRFALSIQAPHDPERGLSSLRLERC